MLLLTMLLCLEAQAGDDLVQVLGRLNEQGNRPVLVGAAGPETARYVERVLKEHPRLSAQLVTVPYAGNAEREMSRALTSAGLDCGLRVQASSSGGWDVDPYGSCEGAAPLPPAAPTPAAAALPPAPAATPSVAPTPPASAPVAEPLATSDFARLDRTLWAIAEVEAAAPRPGTALALSGLVGFGTGHFYSGDTTAGGIFAASQAAGLLVALGASAASPKTNASANTAYAGLLIFGASHVVDMTMAPFTARKQAREMVRRRRP